MCIKFHSFFGTWQKSNYFQYNLTQHNMLILSPQHILLIFGH